MKIRANRSTGKISGAAILFRLSIFALSVAIPGTAASDASGAEQCQLVKIASFDMGDFPGHMIFVPLVIGGTPRAMLLDTGGVVGELRGDIASEMKLKQQEISPNMLIMGTNGAITTHYVTVPEVGVGPVTISQVGFLLSREIDAQGFDGTIAPNLLRNFDVDLDFGGRSVSFFSPDHCPGKVVYWTREYAEVPFKLAPGGQIELTMTLDGHEMDTILDTGSTFTIVNMRIASSYFGMDENSPAVKREQTEAQQGIPFYTAKFGSLSVGGISVPNPTLHLIPDMVQSSARFQMNDKMQHMPGNEVLHLPQMILGLDVLQHLHIYIAYGEKTLYVSSADAHL